MASPFEGIDAQDEFSLSRSLRANGELSRLDRFRDEYVTQADFRALKAQGANVVRIPFGFWIVSSTVFPSDYHTGRGLEYLDDAIRWAEAEGLSVVLGLHGAPGGQSHAQTCGREWPEWTPLDFSAEASTAIISIVAKRYCGSAALIWIEVLNEPEVGLPELAAYYVQAYEAVRQVRACTPESVAVVVNPYPMGSALLATAYLNLHLPISKFPNLIYDMHLYYAFNPPWLDTIIGTVGNLTTTFVDAQTALISHVGRPTFVGEWSVQLPGGGPIGAEFSAMNTSTQHAVETAFGANQQAAMKAQAGNLGSIFWSSKASGYGPNPWSFQSSIKERWVVAP